MATKNTKKTYEATTIYSTGALNSPLFQKMVSNGDVTAISVKDNVGKTVKVNGSCKVHVKTEEKEFDCLYISTNIGIMSTGSEVFEKSYETYKDEASEFVIMPVKCKQGTAYKLQPTFGSFEEIKNEEVEELPFE